MSQVLYAAAPLSIADIRRAAARVRRLCGAPDAAWLDIVAVLEDHLDAIAPGFNYHIVPDGSLPPGHHAETDPLEKEITILQSVYDDANRGKGRDRGTIGHEIGHAVLHPQRRLTRIHGDASPVTYCDPEWQAKCFQGELLLPPAFAVKFRTAEEAASGAGVSPDAARLIFSRYRKEGLMR